uniref:Uncharacterized protein n=1 Tax=Anas platyrhynchos platyrhynchos TaxID=8840 RepID=A0A493TPD5_ANAPP
GSSQPQYLQVTMGTLPPPHINFPHTVRSLDRALEEAGSSGILCLSGRKLRDFPGSGYDLSDTTQAGVGLCRVK